MSDKFPLNRALTSLHNGDRERRKVLVVEDEESVRKLIQRVLQRSLPDFDVVSAENSADALAKLAMKSSELNGQRSKTEEALKNVLALVISDIRMDPGIDGIELVKEIRNPESKAHIPPNTPVILASGGGYCDQAIQELRMNDSIQGFLPKPLSVGQIKKGVQDAIGVMMLTDLSEQN